jgi:hypothetical protein
MEEDRIGSQGPRRTLVLDEEEKEKTKREKKN